MERHSQWNDISFFPEIVEHSRVMDSVERRLGRELGPLVFGADTPSHITSLGHSFRICPV